MILHILIAVYVFGCIKMAFDLTGPGPNYPIQYLAVPFWPFVYLALYVEERRDRKIADSDAKWLKMRCLCQHTMAEHHMVDLYEYTCDLCECDNGQANNY